MQRRLRVAAGVFAMFAAAACQSKKSSDDALARELDSASGASSGVLPMSGGTDVVSAIERSPTAKKNPVVAQPKSAQHSTAKAPEPTTTVAEQAPQPDPQPVPVATTPSPVQTASAPSQSPAANTIPRPESGNHYPSPAHHPQPRRGGYPSTGDIIRNAPFPINP
jgi:hypothetical protein